MIMRRGETLLLPASVPFVWFTVCLAFLLSMGLNILAPNTSPWVPDLTLLVIMFWAMHQPRHIGISAAFVFGLFNDVQQSALLGQHAFTYSLAAYFAIHLQRRLAYFSASEQAIQLVPVLASLNALQWLIRWLSDSVTPSWSMFLAPVLEVMMWPILDALLLAPQRRPPDQDDHRPL
jgi:rod shape-determining protein MreD